MTEPASPDAILAKYAMALDKSKNLTARITSGYRDYFQNLYAVGCRTLSVEEGRIIHARLLREIAEHTERLESFLAADLVVGEKIEVGHVIDAWVNKTMRTIMAEMTTEYDGPVSHIINRGQSYIGRWKPPGATSVTQR